MTNRERWLANDIKLHQLDPAVIERFERVVKRMENAEWRPLVVETRRGAARQAWLRARGRSWVKRSKHQDGLAMDIISALHPWPETPLAFMVDLALSAREEGLSTGLTWKMRPTDEAYITTLLQRANRDELLKVLARTGHGADPCHCEVP